MTKTFPAHTYISREKVNTARALLAQNNWQDSTQYSHIQRAAVLQLVIDWAQGRSEAPESILAVIDDSHIGSGRSGFSLGQRINLILDKLVDTEETDSWLYAPLTAEGLDNLIKWLLLAPARALPWAVEDEDETLDMHPNQRRALKDVAREDRRAVIAHAHFLGNVSGGTLGGNIAIAVGHLKSAGSAEALMAQDQRDNERLMARDGLSR